MIVIIITITFLISDRAAGQRRQQRRDSSMEVEDVCVSEGVCEVMCDVPSNEPHHGDSMETHVSEEEANQASPASVMGDTDSPAAGHINANMDAEPPKPRFSYRLDNFNGYQFICFIMNAFILI